MATKTALACKKLEINEEQVLSATEYDDHIILVIDYGILGAKKVKLMFDELPGLVEAKQAEVKAAQKVEAEEKGVKVSYASDKPKRRSRR
jgi:hypothetical protein